jgi:protein-S-isoprenylcysteine O-methyltransferase Ste14
MSNVLRYIDAIGFAGVAAFVISRHDYGVRFFVGMTIAAVGIALWALARIQLGSSFAVKAEAKKLVTNGLYSKIRNPVYLFGGMGYVGFVIALGNWIVLGVFLIVNLFQIARIKNEERVLEQAFGDEYRRYKASTWF